MRATVAGVITDPSWDDYIVGLVMYLVEGYVANVNFIVAEALPQNRDFDAGYLSGAVRDGYFHRRIIRQVDEGVG